MVVVYLKAHTVKNVKSKKKVKLQFVGLLLATLHKQGQTTEFCFNEGAGEIKSSKR